MDVNNMDDRHEDDTIGAPDDIGTVSNTDDNTGVQTVEYAVEGQEKPLLKDAKTGKFIKGTGHSGKGGRKKGSKDRVSQQLVDIAQSLMERRGAELLEEVADRAPEQALALITKIIPATELTALFERDRQEAQGDNSRVTISVVGSPSQRLPDNRTEAQIQAQQRGLTRHIERLTEPSEDAVVATQEQADEEAAQAERERIQRRNEAVKAHGGLTGRPKRREPSDVIEYPDDPGYV